MAEFTEVTSQSWFSRIAASIKGVVVGLVLFVVAFPVLWWNEGRAVTDYKTIQEGASAAVEAPADRVDPGNDKKLVHLTAQAKAPADLKDPLFGVSSDALRLKRHVEMYQWKEEERKKTKKKLGGGTETLTKYEHKKVWSSKRIDSDRFHEDARQEYANPSQMLPGWSETAEDVKLGPYKLPSRMVGGLSNFRKVRAETSNVEKLPADVRERSKLYDGSIYIGAQGNDNVDPANPRIGDTRITFQAVPEGTVSIIAQQAGDTFQPYTAETGGTISYIKAGSHSADEMFAEAEKKAAMLTWLLRVGGLVLMLLGVMLVFRPLVVVADFVPFIGSILGMGTFVIGLAIAFPLWLLTIAVAWLRYRPLLAVALIVVGVGVFIGLKFLRKGGKAPAEVATQEPAPPSA